MLLPQGLDEPFEMVRFERTDKAFDIWLDEKKKLFKVKLVHELHTIHRRIRLSHSPNAPQDTLPHY